MRLKGTLTRESFKYDNEVIRLTIEHDGRRYSAARTINYNLNDRFKGYWLDLSYDTLKDMFDDMAQAIGTNYFRVSDIYEMPLSKIQIKNDVFQDYTFAAHCEDDFCPSQEERLRAFDLRPRLTLEKMSRDNQEHLLSGGVRRNATKTTVEKKEDRSEGPASRPLFIPIE